MHSFLPHTFRSAKTIGLPAVRENAEHLYATAKRIARKRYSYFSVPLYISDLDQADIAAEGQFPIRAEIDWTVIGVDLAVYGDSSVTGTDDIAMTCSLAPWNTVTATASHSTDSDTAGKAAANQNLRVDSGEEVTFTFSLPATSSASCVIQAMLHVRVDSYSEESVTLTEPPRPVEGDSYSVTEWNSWFTTFSSELDTLVQAMERRSHFELLPGPRNTGLSHTSHCAAATRNGYVSAARTHFLATSASRDFECDMEIDKDGTPVTVTDGTHTSSGATWESESKTVTTANLPLDKTDSATVTTVSAGGCLRGHGIVTHKVTG